MTDDRLCLECGEKPRRTGGRLCARCNQRKYRATEGGRRRHNDAVIRYNAKHPEKHAEWEQKWRESVGISVPDLQDLRRAINRLEATLEEANQRARLRGPGERSRDSGSGW